MAILKVETYIFTNISASPMFIYPDFISSTHQREKVKFGGKSQY